MKFEPGMVVLVRDPRVLEEWLLGAIGGIGTDHGFERIVVPSESLRRHWVRRIVQQKNAVLGVEVCTHKKLARRLAKRTGQTVLDRTPWVNELARDVADDETMRTA